MSYFTKPLGGGYAMNPSTGEILETNSGRVFRNSQELRAYASQPQQQSQGPSSSGGNSNPASNIPSPSTIEKGYDQVASLFGGSGSSAGSYSLANSLGSSAFGSQAGGIGSSQLGTVLGGTSAGLGAGGAAGTYSLGSALGSSAFGSAAGGIGAASGLGAGGTAGGYSLGSALGSSAFGSAAGGVGATSGTVAGATGGASAAGGGLASTMSAVAWPLAIAAAVYQASANYEGARKASGGTLSKADTNTIAHPFGMPKPLRGLERFMSKVPLSPGWIMNNIFGSGVKAQERGARKVNRRVLQDAGLMDPDSRSRYNLYDGSQFDISEYKANTGKDAYNINFDGTENADGISFLNAMTTAALGDKTRKGSDVKDGKTSSDLTGELYNAAMSNGDFANNIRSMGDKLGGRDAIYQAVGEQFKADRLDANKRDALFAAIDKQYGIKNLTGARWEDQAGLTEKQKRHNDEQLAKGKKVPKAPMGENSSVDRGYTTKPLPINGLGQTGTVAPTSGLNTSSTGGRPATPISNRMGTVNLTPATGTPLPNTIRPGANKNPRFKGKK
jgi:hypothetical protein